MGAGGTVAPEMGRPSREGEGRVRARAGSAGEGSRLTRPLGPEGGRTKEKKFSFYNLFFFQIQFSNVFEYLLNFDSNQLSQKYLCNNMHA
jgi:hypothetical protein